MAKKTVDKKPAKKISKKPAKAIAKKAAPTTPKKSAPAKGKRGPGRPAKSDDKRLVVVGTRVSPRVFTLLKKQADKEEVSVSYFLRTMCRKAVKEKEAA